ncbi:MAG: hypothetical protein CL763_09700 [Chloroflexi bacterium]|nr:hypothetical protein [Chloroflexota bacterium]MBL77179.1 hypothetical protein [Chloroflexota bacterium]
MILQILHLTISTIHFDNVIENLIKLGYELKLIENQQKNLLIKKNLMTGFSAYHKLALLESNKNFNIEIVQYEEINMKTQTFLSPKFQNSLINSHEFLDKLENKDEKNYLENSGHFEFTKIEISTQNIEKSKNFWKKLGFLQSENDSILNFNSLIDNKIYNIELIEKPSTTFLNDHGITCIAFLTNSIISEKKSLDDDGYFTTDIELLDVGNNRFAIFFCKNHSGEIVEFISLENK